MDKSQDGNRNNKEERTSTDGVSSLLAQHNIARWWA